MALKDKFSSLMGRVSGAPSDAEATGSTAKVATGESRGYVPPRGGQVQQQPVQQAQPQQPQFTPFQQTGMQTGMQPPVNATGFQPRMTQSMQVQPVQQAQPKQKRSLFSRVIPARVPKQDKQSTQDFAPPVGNMQPVNTTGAAPVQGFTSQMPYHQQPMGQTGYQQRFSQTAQQPQQPQQPAYQPHFTQTAQQPANTTGYQQRFGQTAQQPPVQQMYGQSAQQPPVQQMYGQSAQQPPVQQPYGRAAQPQQARPQPRPGFTDRMAPPPPQPSVRQAPLTPEPPHWGNGQGDPAFNYSSNIARVSPRARRAQQQPQQQQARQPQQPAPNGNVVYINKQNFVDQNGTAYAMTMRLAQPSSTSRCYRIIEFMRNGETVLANMELVTDRQECDRCLDLLFGAAYAMGYTFTRVANRTLYLIAPSTVDVQTYASLNDLTQRDNANRWPGSDPSNGMDTGWQRVATPQPAPFAQSAHIASMTNFY